MSFPAPGEMLRRFGLRPKKSFGQNFIREPDVVERMVKALPKEPARVLEIGAGLGALTFALLEAGHWVAAVERDRDLLPVLRELFAAPLANGRLALLEADAASLDFGAELDAMTGGAPEARLLVGNVPYNLTGILLRKATESRAQLQKAAFLVQREVADRLVAEPDTENYGALSVFAQAAFDVKSAFAVGRGAFLPVPRVDSRVVLLTPRTPPRAEETPTFRALVRAAFEQRRKTLRNAWSRVRADAGAEQLAEAAKRASISLDRRGETLSVEDFRNMGEALDALGAGA